MNKPSKQNESSESGPKPKSRSVKSSISDNASKEKRLRRLFQSAFEGWGDEITGWLLVLGGLLGALSIYFDRAGVVGQVLDDAIGWTVGLINLLYLLQWGCLEYSCFERNANKLIFLNAYL